MSEQRDSFDEQQALMLEVLRHADGAPVSYRELRRHGVEYPASVASELELAGVRLERRLDCAPLDGSPGVLLDLRSEPDERAVGHGSEAGLTAVMPGRLSWTRERFDLSRAVTATADRGQQAFASLARFSAGAQSRARRATVRLSASGHALAERARRPRRAPGRLRRTAQGATIRSGPARLFRAAAASRERRPTRWPAAAALIAAGATVAALTASDLGAPGGARRAAAHRSSAERPAAGRTDATNQPPAAPTVRVSPALAAELEARGHQLLETGQLRDALPALRQALAATGQTLASCLEPTSEPCLTYAYALYDLGRALQLARQPAAAVPILEQRLQIANQRATVHSELQLARQEVPARAG